MRAREVLVTASSTTPAIRRHTHEWQILMRQPILVRSSFLHDVGERVGHIFASSFKEAGFDPKAAPTYAHALNEMVTFVGQWWTRAK